MQDFVGLPPQVGHQIVHSDEAWDECLMLMPDQIRVEGDTEQQLESHRPYAADP